MCVDPLHPVNPVGFVGLMGAMDPLALLDPWAFRPCVSPKIQACPSQPQASPSPPLASPSQLQACPSQPQASPSQPQAFPSQPQACPSQREFFFCSPLVLVFSPLRHPVGRHPLAVVSSMGSSKTHHPILHPVGRHPLAVVNTLGSNKTHLPCANRSPLAGSSGAPSSSPLLSATPPPHRNPHAHTHWPTLAQDRTHWAH